MPNCAVKSCKNFIEKSKKKDKISYHRFPANPVRLNKWIGILRLQQDFHYNKDRRICSAHFKREDFVVTKCGKRNLKNTAEPYINVPKPRPSQSVVDEADLPGSGGESPGSVGGESPANASGGEGGSGRGGEGACAACGGDVGTRGRPARGSPAEQLIEAAIFPRELNDTTLLCNACYKRYCNTGKQTGQKPPRKSSHSKGAYQRVALSEESANLNVSTPPTSNVSAAPQQTITLPNYKRAPSHHKGCLFPNCPVKKLHIIPQYMKQCLLRDYQLYTPGHGRVCHKHLSIKKWEPLLNIAKSDFTAQQIEDLISILAENINTFNFDNIEDIPPNLLLYCTGINHGQLQNILAKLPTLTVKTKTPVLALTAYLTKLRTNDSFDRLSTLFQTTASVLEKLITVARDCMLKEFVTDHSTVPSSTGETEKAIGVMTEDECMLSYLHEHYYGDGSITQATAAPYLRSENLALCKPSQCRKRKTSSDSDDDSLASKVTAKKRVMKAEVETKMSIELSEVAVEFDAGARAEAQGVSEGSEDEESEQARVKEEPEDEDETADEGERGEPEDQHLVYAPKPTEDPQSDPLDTVPAPLLEQVKSEKELITVKVEPEGEEDSPTQQTAEPSSQRSTASSFTVYYSKGASNFTKVPAPKK